MRSILFRSLISLIVFLCLAALLSPFTSLFLKKKYRDHAYAELIYQAIAKSQTKNLSKDEEKVEKLFLYVQSNQLPVEKPYEGKPLDYLVNGGNWCDYQARTLNSLLGKIGILSRYAMMVDKNGISPHTINEVFIQGKWALFDPLNNLIFKVNGSYLDVKDLESDPKALKNVLLTNELEFGKFEYFMNLFSKTLPFEKTWRRSTPRVYQYHIIDKLISLYQNLWGQKFINFYQNIYLRKELKGIVDPAQVAFFKARHYHLANRFSLASDNYRKVIENYKDSKYFLRCVYFQKRLKDD